METDPSGALPPDELDAREKDARFESTNAINEALKPYYHRAIIERNKALKEQKDTGKIPRGFGREMGLRAVRAIMGELPADPPPSAIDQRQENAEDVRNRPDA